MAITPWLHHADHPLAFTCRSPPGSNTPVGDNYSITPGETTQADITIQSGAADGHYNTTLAGVENAQDTGRGIADRKDVAIRIVGGRHPSARGAGRQQRAEIAIRLVRVALHLGSKHDREQST
jgi:hypothetical protein